MVPEKVIVTIETASGQFLGDYELPAAVPVKVFKPLLLDALKQCAPEQFRGFEPNQMGLFLCEEDRAERIAEWGTLADCGAWDGSRLMLRPVL